MKNTRRKSDQSGRVQAIPGSPEELLQVLSPRQRAVVNALSTDGNLSQAARAARVDRQTVYNWLDGDPHFIAALNAWKSRLAAEAGNRLMALTGDAVTTLGDAIRGGDSKAAMTLLRECGALAPPKIGPTEPAAVSRQLALERRIRQADQDRREERVNDDEKMQKMFNFLESAPHWAKDKTREAEQDAKT